MTFVSSSTSSFSSFPPHLRSPHPFDPHSILIILFSLFSSNLCHLRLRSSLRPPKFHHVFILHIFFIQYLSSATSSFSSSSHPSYNIFIRLILIPSLIKAPFLFLAVIVLILITSSFSSSSSLIFFSS